jgi:acetylornithine deacetylase/succinyl-diaminopimelate desuccinylase-like protein
VDLGNFDRAAPGDDRDREASSILMRRWTVPIIAAIAGLALIAGIVIYDRGAKNEIESQLYVPKPEHITPEIQLLQQYVRIETTNPPGNERPGALFLANLLEKNGVKAELIESAPGRTSVYARLQGRRPGEGLLLLNHIDVVPAAAKQWRFSPFSAKIALNQLWGRGSLDMKSIALCELDGFLAVARTHRTPERDLVFLAVADEEEGGKFGTAWLLQHRPDVFEGIRYAINEGGVTETKQERLTYFGIEIGTKLSVRLRISAPSREQLRRLRIALEPYAAPRDPDRILPEVREFLHDIAPHRVEIRSLLDDVVRTERAGKFWLLPQGYKELTQNVVWTSAVNMKDARPTMDVSLYNLPDEDPDRRIEWLRSQIAPFGAMIDEVISKDARAPLSSRRTPLFALIAREARTQYGQIGIGTEVLAASTNDSRYLRSHGIICYGVWPFEVNFYQALGIHGIDERIRLDWYMDGIALSRRLISAYAFEPLR